jgi:hypothetical protein
LIFDCEHDCSEYYHGSDEYIEQAEPHSDQCHRSSDEHVVHPKYREESEYPAQQQVLNGCLVDDDLNTDEESRQNGEIRADTLETEEIEQSVVRNEEKQEIVQGVQD